MSLLTEEEIFAAAMEKCPAERASFLDRVCAGDAGLRGEVESLLKAHEAPDSLLSPTGIQATIAPAAGFAEDPGTLIGPYKLLEQIGEGGMGLVYMAEQQQPVRRLVALKLVKPGMDTKHVIARFEAERQALAMMDHTNIAKVHDAGATETGRPYFVMELVRGIPINEFCDQQRLTVRQRLELFIHVCQAVQHAHQKGIIHRDLKPTNVLVAKADTVPLPKVIDFGIAKALGPSLTNHTLHTGFAQLVGTPMYMSPEQAEMNQLGVDTRSDVYSLGVLLYELLTGTTPFDKDRLKNAGFDEMRRIIREEEPETVSARIARTKSSPLAPREEPSGHGTRSVPATYQPAPRRSELDWIAMKALEKDRTRRYESASALAADIQRYLSDEPVLACPPTTMYRFQKFARKHQPALVTAAAIAACLLVGTTVSAWQAVRATTAEAQATANEQKATTERDEAQRQRDEVTALADKLVAKDQQLQRTVYAANMTLAKHAWDQASVSQAIEMLDQCRPKPGEADLRGFEWHYLNRLCHAEILTLKGHSAGVVCVVYSPDGKRLASASWSEVKVWDAQTGREQVSIKGGNQCVAFSPDGKRLASASSSDKTVKIWDAQTGENLLTCTGHTEWIYCVAFSPDGQRLASGTWNEDEKKPGEVKVWDAATGQELHSFTGPEVNVYTVTFSPDSKRLASAGGYSDGVVKVWDVQSGQEVLSLKGWSAAFSPDGKRLATSDDDALKMWDAQTGQVLLAFKEAGGHPTFSPDGKQLATASSGRTVRILNSETGEELFIFHGHANSVRSVAFSPDGTRLASTSLDLTIKVWDATTSPEARTSTRSSRDIDFANSAFSPDRKRIASTSADGTVKVLDAQTGQDIFVLKEAGRKPTFSPDGKGLATLRDNSVKMWDAQTGEELFTCKGHSSGINDLAFSPDGSRLATHSRDSTVRVWDAQTGQEILVMKATTFPAGTGSLVFSPDGMRLASTCKEDISGLGPGAVGQVKVWDAQTGQELHTLKGHSAMVRSVVYSPDGKRLASGAGHVTTLNGEVKIWDTESGHELLNLKGPSEGQLAFSPDGRRLTSTNGRTVKIYDATPLPEKP